MDFTIAWFPLFKFAITAFLIGLAYYLNKKEETKAAIVVVVFILLFWIFAPVKYDGTETKKRNIQTQDMRKWQYKEVSANQKSVHTVKPTFAERLQNQDAYSKKANQEIINEIIK